MFVHSRWCISLFLVERLGFEFKLVECVWRRKEEGTQTKIQHNPGSPARPTPSPTAHPFHSQPKPAPFNFLPHRPINQRPAQLARAWPSVMARSLCSLPPSPAFRSRSPRERPLWLTPGATGQSPSSWPRALFLAVALGPAVSALRLRSAARPRTRLHH